MSIELSIPLLAKVAALCVHLGFNFDGKAAIANIKEFADAFKGDLNVGTHAFETLSQGLRNHVGYRSADFTLSACRKYPVYTIEIVPVVLRHLGMQFEDSLWQSHKSQILAPMSDKHGPFAADTSKLEIVATNRKRRNCFLAGQSKSRQRQVHGLQLQVKYLQERFAIAMDPHAAASFSIAPWHSKNMYFDKVPVWRGVHLVLRRAWSRVSARKVGLSAGLDIHQTTVNLWGLRTHAAAVAERRGFYKTCDGFSRIAELSLQGSARVALAGFYTRLVRCDVTIPQVWQELELHCLTALSEVKLPGRRHLLNSHGVADLLAISSSTAVSLLQMVKDQMLNIGLRTWTDVADTCFIHSYIFCTDAGGDIAATRRLIAVEVANALDNVFLFDCDCLMHQYSLATGNLLKLADRCLEFICGEPFKYTATLVKIFNVWREHAAPAYFIAQELHSEHLRHFENMPPKCLPSRWGTKDVCEEKYLKLPPQPYTEVMKATLDKRLRSAAKQCMNNESDVSAALAFIMSVDEAQLTSRGGYSEKMGSMSRDAMRGIESKQFRWMCHISFTVCKSWRMCREFLQSHTRLVRDTGLGAMAHLVHGEAAKLRAGALELTHLRAWADFLKDIDLDTKDRVIQVIHEMSMLSLALFERRIMTRVNSLQAQLLIMVKVSHDQACEERQASST